MSAHSGRKYVWEPKGSVKDPSDDGNAQILTVPMIQYHDSDTVPYICKIAPLVETGIGDLTILLIFLTIECESVIILNEKVFKKSKNYTDEIFVL